MLKHLAIVVVTVKTSIQNNIKGINYSKATLFVPFVRFTHNISSPGIDR